jgi:predicted chitinase
MSNWQDFLDELFADKTKPGKVMICFVNRYLEGLDGIKYKVCHDGVERTGTTTMQNFGIELTPRSLKPIQTYVWSRKAGAFKKLDDVVPELGRKKLVRKVLKTFKVEAKTEPLPTTPVKPRPTKPAIAPAPAPSPAAPQGVMPKQQKNESDQPQAKVDRPVSGQITLEQMLKIWPSKDQNIVSRLNLVKDELNQDLTGYKLDTPLRRAHFFAQVREEAGPYFKFAESLDYAADRLKRPKAQASKGKPASPFSYFLHYNHHAEADLYGRTANHPADQKEIANRVYAKKNGNGDESSGDGWLFKGRGLKQLTGRANYRGFTSKYAEIWGGSIDFEKNPELLEQPAYAVRSAVWFWLNYRLFEIADKGADRTSVDEITAIINKNTGSYEARWLHFSQRAWPTFK